MSADKHKKRDRAYAYLRKKRTEWWSGKNSGEPVRDHFSGPPNSEMRWLVEKGLGAIERTAEIFGRCWRARRNVFVEKE